MNTRSSLRPAAVCAGFLAAVPLLGGCGGGGSSLNPVPVAVPAIAFANPFGIDKKAAAVTLSNPALPPLAAPAGLTPKRAVLNFDVNTFLFPNQSPVSMANVESAQLSFRLSPAVTLEQTGTRVKQFTLQTFSAAGEIDDMNADGTVNDSITLPTLSTAGPITFILQADGTYGATTGVFRLSQATSMQGGSLQKLISIVTAEQPSNRAVLTMSASSPDLPSGTVMHITFSATMLTLNAN